MSRTGWLVLGSLTTATVAFSVSYFLSPLRPSELVTVLLFSTTGLALLVAVRSYSGQNGPWEAVLDPRVGPLAYLVYALLIPPIYMTITGSGIGSIGVETLTPISTAVMCITVLSYIVGSGLITRLGSPRHKQRTWTTGSGQPDSASLLSSNARAVAQLGRALLVLALLAKIYEVRSNGTVFSGIYGANQLSFGASTSIAVLGESMVGVGTLLVMFGNTRIGLAPLRRIDFAMLGSVLLVSVVLLGSRGEALAPIILYVWFRARMGRRVGRFALAAGVALMSAALLLVWQTRSASSSGGYPLLQQLLWQTSSPQLLTSNVTNLVPASTDFYFGSTYLNALKFFAPGPITRALFGPPEGTGALEYRKLIDFTNPNQGFGFALPTEAYLNFGLLGVAVIGFALGVLLQGTFAWAIDSGRAERVSSFAYPLLISYLPYGLRTDALGQLKSIVYPLLLIALALLVIRSLDKTSSGPPSRIPSGVKDRASTEWVG